MLWYLFFPYTVWFFIPFAFCDLVGVAGAPAGENGGKNIIETSPFSMSHLGNQVFHFLLKMAHIFLGFSLIINVPIEAFFILFDVPGQV